MIVAIAGASGLIGTELVLRLEAQGHSVLRLVRRKPASGNQVYWNWETKEIDAASLEGISALINLAGENIAGRRWSSAQKNRLMKSRVEGAALLSKTLKQLKRTPEVMISASAIGYYGDRGSELLTEGSIRGSGFLSDICVAWEEAATKNAPAETRVVFPRFGIVLSGRGGALQKMLLPFKLGLGGRIGNGTQYMSWVSLHDTCEALLFFLERSGLRGAYNVTAPNPSTNREFARELAHQLGKPSLLPLPAGAVSLVFGEMGQTLLLGSTRAVPQRLIKEGFSFRHSDLAAALEESLRST